MSIPGLGQDEPEEEFSRVGVPTEQIITHDLRKETEWRFEVAVGKSIEVKVCFVYHGYNYLLSATSDVCSDYTDDHTDHTRVCRALWYRSRPKQILHLHRDQGCNLYMDRMHDPGDM